MDGLQRSQISFRRQGSSGVVWDDKFLNSLQDGQQQEQQSISSGQGTSSKQESEQQNPASEKRSKAYRAVKVSDDEDPPSPRVSSCGFCFGKKSSAGMQEGSAKSSVNKVVRKV